MKAVDLVANEILKSYTDKELVRLLKLRPKKSILYKAVLVEMAKRCTKQYEKEYGDEN